MVSPNIMLAPCERSLSIGLLDSFYFDPVCSILHDLIRACICNALVLNVNVSFKVTLHVSAKQQRLVIILKMWI